ncbi:hypothetical protein [Vreelandella glaciei]|uniref:hypothetical protein n=1 Tax=Vreelandella glaciei TaxID=186761 RepID=UPI00300370DF
MDSQTDGMYYKSICFDLPFLIFVKDGFKDKQLEGWAKAYQAGETLPYSPYAPNQNRVGDLTIGGGFPVYLPDKLENAYVVKVGEKFVGIQFLRRIAQNNPANLCGEIEGDRTGRASFSSVRVNFDLRIFDSKHYLNARYFVNLAIDAINKFIEHYRVATRKHYIRPVTPAIIQSFTIINSYHEKPNFVQHYVTDKTVLKVEGDGFPLLEFNYFMDAMMHGMGGAISDDIDVNLRGVLDKDIEPSIIETLHLEVKDKLELREWRLAAIEAAVLFETFLNIKLRDSYKAQGLSDSDIEDKFRKNDRFKTPLSSYAIAKELIQDATGFDFYSTEEFKGWSNNTKDLRNDVVHGKRYKVTKLEAEMSYKCVEDSINLLSIYL